MRENHQVALYVACGDLKDIQIIDDSLKIFVEDSTMFTILTEGKRELERAISWQGLNLGIEILQKEVVLTKQEQDINRLKEVFGNKLNIIN